MSTADVVTSESRTFEADVSKLLHLMAHSVYSDREVFLRELISNAADACERLRFEGIASRPSLADDPKPRITLIADSEHRRLIVEDNGIGMSREEMVEGLGTIARSGTKAFVDRVEATSPRSGRLMARAPTRSRSSKRLRRRRAAHALSCT
jgi:molecular chaperone HtpG